MDVIELEKKSHVYDRMSFYGKIKWTISGMEGVYDEIYEYDIGVDVYKRQIWGYELDGENRTVDVHIRTLRSKLGSAGKLIQTGRGLGYKIGGSND